MYKNFIARVGTYLDRFYNPYPNIYSDSSTHLEKNYRRVLFKPGPIQAAELNEVQSMFHYNLKTISDSIYKDSGALLTDPDVSITYYDVNYLECESGVASYFKVSFSNDCNIYFDGSVINVPIKDLPFLPMYTNSIPNSHYIGLLIMEDVVTSADDLTLADPQTLIDNAIASDSTMDRYKISAEWRVNTQIGTEADLANFLSIYFFTGGLLINANNPIPELKVVTSVAARYDKVAHGNYVNNGLATSFRDRKLIGSTYYHRFLVSPGNANVDGYNFNLPETSPLVLEDISLTPGFIFEASDIEIPNFVATTTKAYNLAYFHGLVEILSLTGTKSKGPVPITRGNYVDDATLDILNGLHTGNADSTNQSFYITKVALTDSSGSLNTPYVFNVDYKISEDLRSIEWITTNQPDWGTTYYIKYWYNFTYSKSDSNPLFRFTEAYANITGVDAAINSTRTLVTIRGSLFDSSCTKVEVSFKHCPPRKDLIVLTHKTSDNQEVGVLERVIGSPSLEYMATPEFNKEKSISLAEVIMQYGKDPVINIDYYTVFKMSDIQKLEKRLDALEYNMARHAEQNKTSMDEPGVRSKDLFVDLFNVTDSKRDLVLETALHTQL